MSFSMGKILMAYRPLYLRGLLMDGQYRLPAAAPAPAPTSGKRACASQEVVPERVSQVAMDARQVAKLAT